MSSARNRAATGFRSDGNQYCLMKQAIQPGGEGGLFFLTRRIAGFRETQATRDHGFYRLDGPPEVSIPSISSIQSIESIELCLPFAARIGYYSGR